jgi:hypothetical protein
MIILPLALPPAAAVVAAYLLGRWQRSANAELARSEATRQRAELADPRREVS